MAAGEEAAERPDHRGDVLRMLRAGTAAEHEDLERTLDLVDPALSQARLVEVLTLMHGFWLAAEAGLDAWARRLPADAASVTWHRRRRADLFAADLETLGGSAATSTPCLPDLAGTDEALGRMYVLEGSTLGGVFIDRHLAGLPEFSGTRLRAFSPYGEETGAMWRAFRSATRDHVATGGSPEAVVTSARATFGALASWCRPAAVPA